MGIILSRVSHPFRNFNLESRAHKIIAQEKPVPAPKHKKDQIDIDRLMKEYPGAYEESLKKNEQLDKHLKDVFVTSTDPNIEIQRKHNLDRPLPLNRETVGDFLYGVKEPQKIPLGKVTLGSALEFITKHQNEPQAFSAKDIAKEFSVPESIVKDILKFYRVFEIYIPQERHTRAKFAGPSRPKVTVIKQLRKELPAKSPEQKT